MTSGIPPPLAAKPLELCGRLGMRGIEYAAARDEVNGPYTKLVTDERAYERARVGRKHVDSVIRESSTSQSASSATEVTTPLSGSSTGTRCARKQRPPRFQLTTTE